MGKIDDSRPCSGRYKRTLKKFYSTRRKNSLFLKKEKYNHNDRALSKRSSHPLKELQWAKSGQLLKLIKKSVRI